jgi:hypothetical protein
MFKAKTTNITSLPRRASILTAIGVASLALIAVSPATARKPDPTIKHYQIFIVHGNGPGLSCVDPWGNFMEDGSLESVTTYYSDGTQTTFKYECRNGSLWFYAREAPGTTTAPSSPLSNAQPMGPNGTSNGPIAPLSNSTKPSGSPPPVA